MCAPGTGPRPPLPGSSEGPLATRGPPLPPTPRAAAIHGAKLLLHQYSVLLAKGKTGRAEEPLTQARKPGPHPVAHGGAPAKTLGPPVSLAGGGGPRPSRQPFICQPSL